MSLAQLQVRIGHQFRQPALLRRAFVHRSYQAEHPEEAESNQRLEFLGDAVLQLIITEALFALYPDEREGMLSKRRAALTKGGCLSQIALDLGLDACLLVGASEEQNGGRFRAAALEDAFEALVGALLLDHDFETARRVVLAIYGPLPARLHRVETVENPKGRLQERVQPQHGNQALRYEITQITGQDHDRVYEARVCLFEQELGRGRGRSKKAAEEDAARAALDSGLLEAS